MKNLILNLGKLAFVLGVTVLSSSALAAKTEARGIEMHTEKVGEATHWMPAEVTVTEGEQVIFKVKHDMGGKYNVHGFAIPKLNISKEVHEHKELDIPATINLKPGMYDIECQLHKPAHIAAKLIVIPKTDIKGQTPPAAAPTK